MNSYILWFAQHKPGTAHHVAVCQDTVIIPHYHMLVAHTLSYQSLHCQPLKVAYVAGYISETQLRH